MFIVSPSPLVSFLHMYNQSSSQDTVYSFKFVHSNKADTKQDINLEDII